MTRPQTVVVKSILSAFAVGVMSVTSKRSRALRIVVLGAPRVRRGVFPMAPVLIVVVIVVVMRGGGTDIGSTGSFAHVPAHGILRLCCCCAMRLAKKCPCADHLPLYMSRPLAPPTSHACNGSWRTCLAKKVVPCQRSIPVTFRRSGFPKRHEKVCDL